MTSRSLQAVLVGARSRLLWLPFLALGLGQGSGCVDPEADYQEFIARPVLVPEASTPDVVLTPCQELLQQDLSGSYFLGCAPKMLPDQPFSLAAQLTVTQADGGSSLTVAFRPLTLNPATLADGIGDFTVPPPAAIASDCTFVQNIGMFELPATTNALGLDVVADQVVMRGKLQTLTTACGDLDGIVVSPPIGLTLAGNGDACVFIRTAMDAPVPVLSSSDYVCDPSQLPPPE